MTTMSSEYMQEYAQTWKNKDEYRFILNLGTHGRQAEESYICFLGRRLSLLKKYRKALNLRSIWGELSPDMLKAYCDNHMRTIQAAYDKEQQKVTANG